ncbi:unnamed protein product [Moneuplotes crassus]|uniref:Uncharacterized protein n=1 Tax=Euplotes crassus TaxID=5936 RepID=A0AAD1XJS9_EUPCR|nr:unnamed protein product [Moneuplotes crassus]
MNSQPDSNFRSTPRIKIKRKTRKTSRELYRSQNLPDKKPGVGYHQGRKLRMTKIAEKLRSSLSKQHNFNSFISIFSPKRPNDVLKNTLVLTGEPRKIDSKPSTLKLAQKFTPKTSFSMLHATPRTSNFPSIKEGHPNTGRYKPKSIKPIRHHQVSPDSSSRTLANSRPNISHVTSVTPVGKNLYSKRNNGIWSLNVTGYHMANTSRLLKVQNEESKAKFSKIFKNEKISRKKIDSLLKISFIKKQKLKGIRYQNIKLRDPNVSVQTDSAQGTFPEPVENFIDDKNKTPNHKSSFITPVKLPRPRFFKV